jgi:hypothetical protein
VKLTSLLAVGIVGMGVGLIPDATLAHAESTMNCPAGTYDMLDWMTLDSDLRAKGHLAGSANPLYSTISSGRFTWTKSGSGSPWDVQLYDDKYIYLWVTEYSWKNPETFKKFVGTNVPFTERCAKGGFPGSVIAVPDTTYSINTSCGQSTTHNLGRAVNEVWGPYRLSFGGMLPSDLPTLVVSYRYNCNASYESCSDKEEFYLTQRYGMVQWTHSILKDGDYEQQQKSVFNELKGGTVAPNFPCF